MNRLFVLSTALVPMSLIACGGGGGDEVITPTGPHTQYVVSKANVPANPTQVKSFGLDLGSPKANKQDGMVDNQLGTVLSTLATMGFKVQDGIDTAVQDGSIILLADIQSEDFTSSNAAGVSVLLGANPMPAPCTDPTMPTTCGQHLKGTGVFTVATNSPQNAALAGKISGGTFDAGPGDVTLQITLGGAAPISLALQHARAQIQGITADGIMTATIGGEVSQDDINNQVIPAVQAQLPPLINRDCGRVGTAPPTMDLGCPTDPTCTIGNVPKCGCMDQSTGATILSLLDTGPADCAVSVTEIQMNSLIKSLLAPDVCTQSSCDKPDALSIGIQVTAVKATFTPALSD
jgi:hypothetical protein